MGRSDRSGTGSGELRRRAPVWWSRGGWSA